MNAKQAAKAAAKGRMGHDFWDILWDKILPLLAGVCFVLTIAMIVVLVWRWIAG